MTPPGFGEQFLEDYFAECDEHLTTMRRVLLSLEAHEGTIPEAAQLQALQRSLHTVKGLSGMVGLVSAERVAHAMEDVLRDTHASADEPIDATVLEALFAATRELELCIAARRAGHTPHLVDDFLAELHRAVSNRRAETDERVLDPTPPSTATPDDTRAGPQTGGARAANPPVGAIIYWFEFTPSPALARRNIGVATIRARLQQLGEVLTVRPRVVDRHTVVFEFRVAVHAGTEPDERWREDGLNWTPEAPSHTPTQPAAPAPRDAEAPAPRDAEAPAPPRTTTPPDSMAFASAGANVVRVDLSRVDELMRLVSELVVSRSRLGDVLAAAGHHAGADPAWQALHETNALLERQLRTLREGITRIRLVPIGDVFDRLRFAIRDVSRETGKDVQLELSGEDTQIDKLVVDRMLEPLMHLVRNAVSHGIEAPEVRVARGKPARGRLALRASALGDRIRIEVEDDGAGVDQEQVAAKARSRGLLDAAESLSPDYLLEVLRAPGFSTRDGADLASGRGVGMAVVAVAVRELGGDLRLFTVPGEGTRFEIELPLTLMIVDALLVEIGGQRMAVPQPALREILQIDESAVTRFESNEVLPYRGSVLPIVNLARLFTMTAVSSEARHLLVVGSDSALAGLLVDRLLGLREIVIHPVPDPLVSVPGIAGATELGDGRVSLILDTAALVRMARERSQRTTSPSHSARAETVGAPPT